MILVDTAQFAHKRHCSALHCLIKLEFFLFFFIFSFSSSQRSQLCKMDVRGLKVRAVTRFVVLSKDTATWTAAISAASDVCSELAAKFKIIGYETQTLRIVTNPFGEYLDTSTLESALEGVGELKRIVESGSSSGIRIRVAIGEARNAAELALVPAMIKAFGDLCNICVNIKADEHGVVDAEMCDLAAGVIVALADTTERGEGNFNFTANFACPPLIPYFPAGYNTAETGECFAVGLEHPELLHSVLAPLQLGEVSAADRSSAWSNAAAKLKAAIETHTVPIVAAAQAVAASSGVRFAGLDSSAAPSKDTVSMCTIFEDLGVPFFGASGTVEAAAFLTRVFKNTSVCDLVGFSGLMLTCLEDEGMASGAAAGQYDIRALLQYSCVCGIGLDCVPIPGDTPRAKIAGLMRDTATLAFRYNKPLTVRLFPCAGLSAGDTTAFESDDLCNCTVFKVD